MLPGPFRRITPLNAKLRAELPCMLLVLNATVSGLVRPDCVSCVVAVLHAVVSFRVRRQR